MRRAARTDANQSAVVERFRQWGASVETMHAVGNGFPDLAVGLCGINLLVEVKDGDKPPSARTLTPDQVDWWNQWQGWAELVETLDDVDRLCERVRQRHAKRYVDAIEPRRER